MQRRIAEERQRECLAGQQPAQAGEFANTAVQPRRHDLTTALREQRHAFGVARFLLETTETHVGAAREQVLQEVPGRDAVAAVGRPRHTLAQEHDLGLAGGSGHEYLASSLLGGRLDTRIRY
jgi:hypothetical protein